MLFGESHFVDVDGIKFHYVVAGEGPPLLLLHGLGASVITWRDNMGPLSQHFRVYAVDLPGHGDSDKPDIDYSLETVAYYLGRLLDVMGLERCSIVGNSVSGPLAIKLGRDIPDRIHKLVLVDSASLGRELSLYIRLVSIPFLGSILESSRVGGTKYMLKGVFYDEKFVVPDLLDELHRSRSMPGAKEAVIRPIRLGVNLLGVRKEFILDGQMKQLEAPLLIVWGANDVIFPVAHAYNALREAPHAQLKVFPECGHWPHMEKSEEFNQLVVEFLSK